MTINSSTNNNELSPTVSTDSSNNNESPEPSSPNDSAIEFFTSLKGKLLDDKLTRLMKMFASAASPTPSPALPTPSQLADKFAMLSVTEHEPNEPSKNKKTTIDG